MVSTPKSKSMTELEIKDHLAHLLEEALAAYNIGNEFLKQYPDHSQADYVRSRTSLREREIAWIGFWHHFIELLPELQRFIIHMKITPVESVLGKYPPAQIAQEICLTQYHIEGSVWRPAEFAMTMVQIWQEHHYGESST